MENLQTVEEAILARLDIPVKTTQGQLAVNEDGSLMTPTQAMAMSVMAQAMRGDIGAINFVRSVQRTKPTAADTAEKQRRQEQLRTASERLRDELKSEGLYTGQDSEIEMLAANLVFIEQITASTQEADFEFVTTEYDSRGNAKRIPNPLLAYRDKIQDKFKKDYRDLQIDAQRRINTKGQGRRR